MRSIIIDTCYIHAGEDPILSDACDLFEKDSNTLLWNSLDYTDMMNFNKHKYTFIYEKMPEHLFDEMMEHFKPIKEALDELLDEVEEHRMLTISRIKDHVEKRTKGIMIFNDVYPNDPDHPTPNIRSYKLEVKQLIPNKHLPHVSINIPRPIRMDGSTSLFDDHGFKGNGLYKGNGSTVRPIKVDKKFHGLAHEHNENQMHHLFKIDEPELEPIKAKVIKDYGEEAESMTLPGEEPKDFMEEFMRTNNEKEYNSAMEQAAFLHQSYPHDIPGHYYGQNPDAQVQYKSRKLTRKPVYKHRFRIIRHRHLI
jgi:hypothetical protein